MGKVGDVRGQIDWSNDYLNSFSNHGSKDLKKAKVAFLVASLGISGGTNYVFQYAQALRSSGAQVTVINTAPNTLEERSWHPGLTGIEVKTLGEAQFENYDLGILTFWDTAYSAKLLNLERILYFVQSLETRFAYNEPDVSKVPYAEALIAATYEPAFPVVTVASWIQNFLAARNSRQVWLVPNGIDRSIFPIADKITDLKAHEKMRVLVEGRFGVEMKAISKTLGALQSLQDVVSVSWVTPSEPPPGIGVGVKIFGPRPLAEMRELYLSHDVLVKMSRVEGMFGPPLEAFHAGMTAIVSRVSGFDEYIVHGYNSLCVNIDNFSRMLESVKYLADHRDELSRLKNNAMSTASNWPTIGDSSRLFIAACFTVLNSKQNVKGELRNLERRRRQIDRKFLVGKDPRQGLEEYCVVKMGEAV